jgi:hypothetical protein
MVDKLYIAKETQWHESFPFRKIKVIKVENDVVHFSTEWPVRKLSCTKDDFNKIFRKW